LGLRAVTEAPSAAVVKDTSSIAVIDHKKPSHRDG
jgi:hypothetical protein